MEQCSRTFARIEPEYLNTPHFSNYGSSTTRTTNWTLHPRLRQRYAHLLRSLHHHPLQATPPPTQRPHHRLKVIKLPRNACTLWLTQVRFAVGCNVLTLTIEALREGVTKGPIMGLSPLEWIWRTLEELVLNDLLRDDTGFLTYRVTAMLKDWSWLINSK
ncbi:hypothetical protein BJ165DRAFT_183212 [Panaeolus papilionaceus]|nr:hypothetical protein BJ165DRAFT_183212 [Panaeolus papilionaceus]